jgi:replicative DNA helicase
MIFKPIKIAADEALKFIIDRQSGQERPLKTRWPKLNRTLLGGLNWHEVTMVGGMSGSGKTLFASQLESDLCELNKDQDFAILSFNFEMMARMLLLRKLSSKSKRSISDLLSVEIPLSSQDIDEAKKYLESLHDYPIYYSETPATVSAMKKTVELFYKQVNKPFVCIIDHTLLTRKGSGQNTNDMVADIADWLIEDKKIYPAHFVLLNQLNRNIESEERMRKPSILNYPTRSDLYYVEALYHACDNVIINHRPYLLNQTQYGPDKIPVTKDTLFNHCIKVRNGETVIIKSRIDGKTMTIFEE